MKLAAYLLAMLALAASIPVSVASAQTTPKIVMEEFMVPAKDTGIQIYLRNKRPEGMTEFSARRTVLFVHGLTYPGHANFDLPRGGRSWMDYVAERGFDVWSVDLRGYGRSSGPPAMPQELNASPPALNAETATADLAAASDFIRERRGLSRLALVAWSWGTVLTARYAVENPAGVERIALYAPVWSRQEPGPASGPPGAYRSVTREAALTTWLSGVPEGKREVLIPPGWFDQWVEANWASDPEGARMTPPVLRVPNGPLHEVIEYWNAGKAFFAPEKITTPVLLIVGEWDRTTPPSMAQALFPLLTNAPQKRLIVIGEATHAMMVEKNRSQLFDEVQLFLEQALPRL